MHETGLIHCSTYLTTGCGLSHETMDINDNDKPTYGVMSDELKCLLIGFSTGISVTVCFFEILRYYYGH